MPKQVNLLFDDQLWSDLNQAVVDIEQETGLKLRINDLIKASVRKWLENFKEAPDQIETPQ